MIIPGKNIWLYDLEVFPNLFLATFKRGNEWVMFRESQIMSLIAFFSDDLKVLVGYNNFSYDDPILRYIALHPMVTVEDIYKLSLSIVKGLDIGDSLFKLTYAETPWAFSIDIFQLLNKKGSLKEWACLEGADVVLEAGYDFEEDLPEEAIPEIIAYCQNDIRVTEHLLKKNWPLVAMRQKLDEVYGLGKKVHVLSEAGVAQHAFMTLHKKRTGQYISKVREVAKANQDNRALAFSLEKHILFPKVQFKTNTFIEMYNWLQASEVKAIDPKGIGWKIDNPMFEKDIELASKHYKIGVGGLHSIDGPLVAQADEETAIIDLDVTSYYPAIIINEKLHPRHIGAGFVKDMIRLRDDRLKAKRAKDSDTNEALKIVINSTFGKLNDYYSPIRSVVDALRITINGQMMLLMLIEMLDMAGAEILSANTDGVTVRWNREPATHTLPGIIDAWQRQTGHELETTHFKRYARRDVNAYLALKEDGKVKAKGAFEAHPRNGKWDGLIIKKAAEQYLMFDVDPEETVRGCHDIKQFLFYQRVKNGGDVFHGDACLSKTARWYVGKHGEQIRRRNPIRGDKPQTWANIPHGANAVLAMDITNWDLLGGPTPPAWRYYVDEAWELIRSTEPKRKKIK